jgi:hypothetical protein
MLPETDVARVRRCVDARNDALPERARGQVHYELDVADRHVTVLECRPPWRPEYGPEWTRFPIVRFHYTATRREWAPWHVGLCAPPIDGLPFPSRPGDVRRSGDPAVRLRSRRSSPARSSCQRICQRTTDLLAPTANHGSRRDGQRYAV